MKIFNNRKCPYCAETIKLGAVVCKHCGRDIPNLPDINKEGQGYVGYSLLSNRKTIIIAITAFLVFLIGGITVSTIVRQKNLQIEYAIQQTQVALAKVQKEPTSTPVVTVWPTESVLPTPSRTPKPDSIRVGQSKTIPGICAIVVLGNEFTTRVLPPNTSGYYTYYEVKKSNAIFLDVIVEITNLDSILKSADSLVNVTLIYNNEDQYIGTLLMVDSRGDFTYGTIYGIGPKLSAKYHYLFEVPDSVWLSTKPLVMVIQPVSSSASQNAGFEYRIR
jgi:hypothetical protein